jgi:hypothetical protein
LSESNITGGPSGSWKRSTVGDGLRVTFFEGLARTEQAGLDELHLRPQVGQPILDRGAGQRHAERGAETMGRARDLRVRVLDGLRLVEDDGVPLLRDECVDVEAQDGQVVTVTSAWGSSLRLGE